MYNQDSRARALRKPRSTNKVTNAFLDRLFGFGHELMYPEAYVDRLASAKQVWDVKKIIRSPISLILLISLSVSAFFV